MKKHSFVTCTSLHLVDISLFRKDLFLILLPTYSVKGLASFLFFFPHCDSHLTKAKSGERKQLGQENKTLDVKLRIDEKQHTRAKDIAEINKKIL